MHVLVHLTWLYDTVGPQGFDSNYMQVRFYNRRLKLVAVRNRNRTLEVPFDAIWNVEELFQ